MNKFHFLVWKRKDNFCPGISWEILCHIHKFVCRSTERYESLTVIFVVVVAHFSIILICWEILSIGTDGWIFFIEFFVNLLTKSSLIFRFFIFFLKKRFTLHEFVYWTTRRKATSLQSANAAEITGKYAAKSETSIWSKYEYGKFIWKKTTE